MGGTGLPSAKHRLGFRAASSLVFNVACVRPTHKEGHFRRVLIYHQYLYLILIFVLGIGNVLHTDKLVGVVFDNWKAHGWSWHKIAMVSENDLAVFDNPRLFVCIAVRPFEHWDAAFVRLGWLRWRSSRILWCGGIGRLTRPMRVLPLQKRRDNQYRGYRNYAPVAPWKACHPLVASLKISGWKPLIYGEPKRGNIERQACRAIFRVDN